MLSLVRLILLQLLPALLLQVLQGLSGLGYVLCKLVVQLGYQGLLDLVYLEGSGLAGQLLGAVVSGEGNLNVLLVAGSHANHLLLEAGDEGAGAQTQRVVLALAAVECYAVHVAVEVDDHGVAVLCSTLHGGDAGVAAGQLLDILVHLFVGDGDGSLGSLDALVLAQGSHGIQAALDGQNQIAILIHIQIGNAGAAHNLELGLSGSLLPDFGENQVDGVLIEDVGAIHTLNDLPGSLALTEAGDVDGVLYLAVSLVQSGLELVLLYLENYLGGIVFILFYAFNVHRFFPPVFTAEATIYALILPILWHTSF